MANSRLIFNMILSEAGDRPHAPAILAPGKETLSYLELSRHLKSTTLQLTRLGMDKNDRLAVVLPNGPEMATAFLAISSVCTCAPLNPGYQEDEFRSSFQALHVSALVTFPGNNHPARKAAISLGIPLIDLILDEKVAGLFTLSCNLSCDETISEPAISGVDNVALVLQTSGTTSHPKTVPITHKNIYYSVNNITDAYALTQDDRCLNMMPLFHIHGLIASLAASLSCGASVICAPGFLPDQVLDWLTRLEPTWYTAVPTIHQSILDQVHNHRDLTTQMKLRFIRSCSSSLAPRLAQDLEATFGVPVLEAYGMTEATHQITSNPLPPRSHKFGSVGLTTGSSRISILDEQCNILSTGLVGEICIQGENVMGGYDNNPSANISNYSNGWLRTGDIGYMDEDSYLFIKGRHKEVINRGGEKITPRDIDEVLLGHPAVQQAVAFAVPHPNLGEDVAVAIVLKKDHTVSVQELRQYVAVYLADFKVPRHVVFVKEIPKGPTGKIQRIGLADKLKIELEAFINQETSDTTEPNTQYEAELLSIWQHVLDKQPIGIHDDFLALGGQSIEAARILLRVNEKFGMDLQLRDIFTASTIALMADLIQEGQNKN